MRQGDMLLKIMKERDVSQSAIARDADVSPTTVKRWLDALNDGSIEDDQWRAFAEALRRADINPELIRPVPPMKDKLVPTDLLPLADVFLSRQQLEALIRIIDAKDGARAVLRVLVAERLKHAK